MNDCVVIKEVVPISHKFPAFQGHAGLWLKLYSEEKVNSF